MDNTHTYPLDEISAFEMKAILYSLHEDIGRDVALSQAVGKVVLPDGRKAEVQITIQTEESEFLID